jgi:hypothetical protein
MLNAQFDKDDSELGFGIQLRNFSSGPIKYTVEEFDLRIANRALPKIPKGSLFGFMARGAGRTSFSPAFKRSDFKELLGRRLEGTANFAMTYGHPESPPARKLSISMAVYLEITIEAGPIGFGGSILDESDQPLNLA